MHFPGMADLDESWADAMRAAGGADGLAAKLGIGRRTFFYWRKKGVPAEELARVAAITNIPAATLRPDLALVFSGQAA